MTLYSIEGKQQEEIGKKEHWNEFKKFQGSQLHKKFKYEISQLIGNSEKINSSHAGKHILAKLSMGTPAILKPYHQTQIGGLFGMTLWNWLAVHKDKWYFYRDSTTESEELAGMVYFQDNKKEI